jgi:hypothetical protein
MGLGLILFVSVAATGGTAEQPERWVRVGGTPDSEVRVDRQRIVQQGSKVTYWLTTTFPSFRTGPSGSYNELVSQWRMDCLARTTTLLSAGRRSAGRTISSMEWEDHEQSARPILPGTLDESVQRAFCS